MKQHKNICTKGLADVLDHDTCEIALGRKLAIDATKKLPAKASKARWPALTKMDAAMPMKIDSLFGKPLDMGGH